jgi:hypothetical protein
MLEHSLNRQGNLEFLSAVMMKADEGIRLHEEAWEVIRMTSVAKGLSTGCLDMCGDLLFGYLVGCGVAEMARRWEDTWERLGSEIGMLGIGED